MATKDERSLAAAAAAGAGGAVPSRWAQQGRETVQGSHSLAASLARWGPALAEPKPCLPGDPVQESEPPIAVPASVICVRPQKRLPDDLVCRSAIAGLVVAVLAAPGEHIAARQPVLIVEAMKMRNDVGPEVDGVLKAVYVAPGDAVKAGQILFELA